jgi:hypothetical protein
MSTKTLLNTLFRPQTAAPKADVPSGKGNAVAQPQSNALSNGRYENKFESGKSYNKTWSGSHTVGGGTDGLWKGKEISPKLASILSKLPTWSKEGSFEKSATGWQRAGSFNKLGGLAQGQGSIAMGQAYVRGQGSVSFANGALNAKGSAEASATLLDAQGSIRLGKGDYTLDASGYAYVGAKANAAGELTIDPARGIYAAKIGGEAFLGAKAGVEGEVKLGKFGSVGGRAEAWAGIGASFNAEAGFKDGKFKARVDFGAALGIGFKLGFNVSIDVKGIKDTIVKTAKKVVEAPVKFIENVADKAKSFVKKLKFW